MIVNLTRVIVLEVCEKRSDFGYILKVKVIVFDDGLNEGCKRKRGLQGFLIQENRWVGLPFIEMKKIACWGRG